MPDMVIIGASVAGGLVLGFLIAIIGARIAGNRLLGKASRQAAQVISDAEREAAASIRDARTQIKEEQLAARETVEEESRQRRRELDGEQKRIVAKEEQLDRRQESLENKASEVAAHERQLIEKDKAHDKAMAEVAELRDEHTRRLEEVSGMSAEQARDMLVQQLENEVRRDCAMRLKRIEDEMVETSEKKARWVITQAIERCAADHVAESTVSVVNLPNDEMKGRIIGREGRNIRALESATGINIIIDDTPEAVILSGFDTVRREISRIALERLITDGRIHPARIEEVVKKVEEEMAATIREMGEAASLEADVHGLHPEVVKLLGRLNYRTSYGQNVLKHAQEVCHLSGLMAAELGLNVAEAKRAGLIHDIGKAVNHEVEGSHAVIGSNLAKRYGEKEAICNAIGAHHNEVEKSSVTSVLVQAADALSAARPGARRETIDGYVKRLEQLESIAESFQGVEKSYALQAGREIRVVVEPGRVNDAEALQLARDVARKVEDEMTYPGQIRVTVIRETRACELAS